MYLGSELLKVNCYIKLEIYTTYNKESDYLFDMYKYPKARNGGSINLNTRILANERTRMSQKGV